MKTHQALFILTVIIKVSANASPKFHTLSQSSITNIKQSFLDDPSSEIKKLDTAGRSRTLNEATIMRLTDSQIIELQTNFNTSFNDAEIKMSFNESKLKEQMLADKSNETNHVHNNISGRSKSNNELTSTIHVWSSNSLTKEQWDKIQKNVEENKDLLQYDAEEVKTDFEIYDNHTSKIDDGRNKTNVNKENASEELKYYSFSKTEWEELKQTLYKNHVDEDKKILIINKTSNNTKHQGRSRSEKNKSQTLKGWGLWNSYALTPLELNQLKENIHDHEFKMNETENNIGKIGQGRSREKDLKSNGHNNNSSAKDNVNVVIVKPVTGEKLYTLKKHFEWDKLLDGISNKNLNATNEVKDGNTNIEYNSENITQGGMSEKMQLGRKRQGKKKLEESTQNSTAQINIKKSPTLKGWGLWNSYALKPSEWNQLKENIHDHEFKMNETENNISKIGKGRSREIDSKSNGNNNSSAKDNVNVVIVKPVTGEKLYTLKKHFEWDNLLEGISNKNLNATNNDKDGNTNIEYNLKNITESGMSEKMQLGRKRHGKNKLEGRRIMQSQMLSDDDDIFLDDENLNELETSIQTPLNNETENISNFSEKQNNFDTNDTSTIVPIVTVSFIDFSTMSPKNNINTNTSQDNFIMNVSIENDQLGNDRSTSNIILQDTYMASKEHDSATESIQETTIINVSVENDQLANDHSTNNLALKEYESASELIRENHIINVSVENNQHLNDHSIITITLQDTTTYDEYETSTESMQNKDTDFSDANEKKSLFITNSLNIDEMQFPGIYDGTTAQDATTNILNKHDSEYTAISDGTTAYNYITFSNDDFNIVDATDSNDIFYDFNIVDATDSNENTNVIRNVINYGSPTSDSYSTTPSTSDTMSTDLPEYVMDIKSLENNNNLSNTNLLEFVATEENEGTLVTDISIPETLNITEILLDSAINSKDDLFEVDNSSSSSTQENISTFSQTTDGIINSNSNNNSSFILTVNESITNSVMDWSATTNSVFSVINTDTSYIMKEERFDIPEETLLKKTTDTFSGNSNVLLLEITKDMEITTPITDNFSEEFSTNNSEDIAPVLFNSNSIVDLIIDEQSGTTVQLHNNVNNSFNINNPNEDPMINSIDFLSTTIIASSAIDLSENIPFSASSDEISTTEQNGDPTQAIIYLPEKLSNNLPNQPQELVGNEIPKTTSTVRPTTVPPTPLKPVAHTMETWIILLIVCILSLIFLVGGIILYLRIARRQNGHFQLSP